VETVPWTNAGCPALQKGDRVGTRLIDHTSLDDLRARTLRYEDVERGAFDPAGVAGRIVLVGSAAETFGVSRGLVRESRSGLELHADAVNTLLSGVTVRPLGLAGQSALTLLMAAAGAAMALFDLGRRRRWLAVLAALVAYLTANVWLYVARQVMLNTLFHLGALFGSFVVAGRLGRRWGVNSMSTAKEAPVISRAAAAGLLAALLFSSGCATAAFGRLDGVTRGGRIATPEEAQAVKVVRAGAATRTEPTEPGMALRKGDRITTGPGTQAVLVFDAGWEVILEAETELEILNPSIFIRFGQAIATALGRVREVLKAQTEYVVAAPETTQYVIEAHGDTFSVTVLEGKVRVESKTQEWPPTVYGPAERGTVVGRARPQRMPSLDARQVAALQGQVGAVRQVVVQATSVRVPDVRGRPYDLAAAILRRSGLESVAERVVRELERPGVVVAQAPAAGALVRRGTRVVLQYAARPPRDIDDSRTPEGRPTSNGPCRVPELRGLTVAQAAQALKRARLTLGDHPRDTRLRVTWQSASPNVALTCGTRISVGADVIR
jgi:hypothetical protein